MIHRNVVKNERMLLYSSLVDSWKYFKIITGPAELGVSGIQVHLQILPTIRPCITSFTPRFPGFPTALNSSDKLDLHLS